MNTKYPQNELLSRIDAAHYLKISTRTLRRYMIDPPVGIPRIPYAKYGNRIVVPLDDLRRWVSCQIVSDGPEESLLEMIYSSSVGVVYRSEVGGVIKFPTRNWRLAELFRTLFPESIENVSKEAIYTFLPIGKLSDVISILEAHSSKPKGSGKIE